MAQNKLFVYGKLKRNQQNAMAELLAQHACFIGEGYVFGKLYKIDDYPGLIPSDDSNEKVFGELYLIKNESIYNELDAFEEAWPLFDENAEYKRLEVIAFVNNKEFQCETYVYNHKVDEANLIQSGIFNE